MGRKKNGGINVMVWYGFVDFSAYFRQRVCETERRRRCLYNNDAVVISVFPSAPPSPPSFLVCSVSSLRPSGRTRSTCGRWHEVRTEGAGVEKQTLSRFPCVLLSSVFKEEAGRKNKTKKKKAHDCVYSPVYSSVAIFATANQVIFTLPCQRVESNDDRTPALTPGLVTAQSGQEGYKSVNRWQLNINLGHYNEVH